MNGDKLLGHRTLSPTRHPTPKRDGEPSTPLGRLRRGRPRSLPPYEVRRKQTRPARQGLQVYRSRRTNPEGRGRV